MSKVLAINPESKEQVERWQSEQMKREFSDFVKNDPEVRQIMLERVRGIVGELSSWDITYHGGFKEVAMQMIAESEFKPIMQEAIKRVLTDGSSNVTYQITQALGECLAGKITMKLEG